MEQYVIKGGTPLRGEVEISGAKNAALGILAGAIMTDDLVTIENLPNVKDVNVLLCALEDIGAVVNRIDTHTVTIDGSSINRLNVDYEYIKKMRASYYLMGALLGKYKKAEVALPGGCAIGARPIDLHIKGLKALGADVDQGYGLWSAKATQLVGGNIYLDKVSVGATINIMLAAVLAAGKTVIDNAAKEPHVVDVANFLNSMGANIRGAGTDEIRIMGVEKLHGTTYSVIPDQIEAGTYMCAAAATRGDILLKNVIPKHLEPISIKLIETGCIVEELDDCVRVIAEGRKLISTPISTQPYPGFPTDMQPEMAAVLAVAEGTSFVQERIFENRFKYVDELNKMGANIQVDGSGTLAVVTGVETYKGAEVNAPDLRAGAALIIAGLQAEGFTYIRDIQYIQRGYEDLQEKLTGLGAAFVYAKTKEDVENFVSQNS